MKAATKKAGVTVKQFTKNAAKAQKSLHKTLNKKPVINDKIFNLHHPDYHGKIEEAFEAEGIKYYCFSKDTDMRYGRYIFMQAFIQEVNLRMSIDVLKKQNADIKSYLDLSRGKIDLGKALEILDIQSKQCDLQFEPDTVFRLSSCLYFDETEDLRKWDKKHNEQKIARWKESHTIDFFFHKLFQELTGLKDLSPTVLRNYLEVAPEVIKGWSTLHAILSQ